MKTVVITLTTSLCLAAQTPVDRRPAPSSAKKPVALPSSLMNPVALNAKAPDGYKAEFATTKGNFVIEVHREWAPLGADRFYNLVRNGFFDDAAFFRVLPGFMAQFGINSSPGITQVWEKAAIKDDPVTQSNKRGYVSFANGGPNTRTTQVFINFGDNSRLDGMGFAPFGMVTEGMDVADSLFNGYGEGAPAGNGPAQDRIQNEGNSYLDQEFPKLDRVISARVIDDPLPAGNRVIEDRPPASAPRVRPAEQ